MYEYSYYISVGKTSRIWLRAVVWLLIRVPLNPAQLTLLPAMSFSPDFGLLWCVTAFVPVLDMSVKVISLATYRETMSNLETNMPNTLSSFFRAMMKGLIQQIE